QEPDRRRRQEPEGEVGHEPAAGRLPPGAAGHPEKPLAVDQGDGADGAELDEDLEGLGAGPGEAEPHPGHAEAAGGGSGEEFGDAFNQAEDAGREPFRGRHPMPSAYSASYMGTTRSAEKVPALAMAASRMVASRAGSSSRSTVRRPIASTEP